MRSRRSRARDVFLVAVTLLASSLGGCSPQAGGSCKVERKEVCVDEKTALACHEGKWEPMTCRGGAGCSKVNGQPVCDQSVAESGDSCNVADSYLCSGDKKSSLQCIKNKWTVIETCIGERGCTQENERVTCDNSIANVGDGCREEADYACSPDRKAALVCKKGHFVQARPCKGPEECKVVGTKEAGFKIKCDDSVAVAGDACEKEEHFACSSDERAILKCRSKKFEIEEKCRSKEKCQIKGGQVGCY
jgi:hypothetical protein